jgi:hypothetical protein
MDESLTAERQRLTIDEVRAAARRIAGAVVRSPTMHS